MSEDGGATCYFIDTSSLTDAVVKSVFPDLTVLITLPPKSQP